jgi:hypothetical protein
MSGARAQRARMCFTVWTVSGRYAFPALAFR